MTWYKTNVLVSIAVTLYDREVLWQLPNAPLTCQSCVWKSKMAAAKGQTQDFKTAVHKLVADVT